MLRISYNANGLRRLAIDAAIDEVADAGFDGIELSLHPNHVDPFRITERELGRLAERLAGRGLPATCLATGADTLLGPERFEPSLIHPTAEGRRRRIDLIRRSLDIAGRLGIPVVNFASGILRPGLDRSSGWALLVEGIHRCLEGCGPGVSLALEPEVGFLVEQNAGALEVLAEVDDPRLGINQDIGHEHVVVDDYLATIERALPATLNMHVEDIRGRVHKHLVPGEGEIDFPAVIRMLLRSGYASPISVELYDHADSYREAMAASLAYLRAATAVAAETPEAVAWP